MGTRFAADYVELFVPKPWLIASTEDDFFTPPGARQVFDEAQRWYSLYDARDRVKWVIGPGGHGTPKVVREAIYEWMDRWLAQGKGTPMAEVTDLLPDRALLVTKNGQVEGRELYQIIRETPRVKGTPQDLSKFVGDLIAANPPVLKISHVLAPAPSESRHPAVVLVQNTLEPDASAEALRAEGHVVAVMTMSGRGEDTERPYTGNWMNNTRAWLVGRNLPATHAAEINAMVEDLAQRSDVDPARIGIWGLSYGGLLTSQALARNSDLFVAGADLAGVHLYGSSLDTTSMSYKSSAISAIDSWKSPVFLVHGDDDRNVDFAQTVGLVQLLRARGVYYELEVVPDDLHESMLHRNWIGTFGRMGDFLHRFVWNKESAAATNGQR